MRKNWIRSFQLKVTLAIIAAMLFVVALSNFLIYKFTLDAQLNGLREKLKVIAQTAALAIDAETLLAVPLNKGGMDSAAYKTIAGQLERIKNANPPIRYIYTMARTEKDSILQFVVDPEPVTEELREDGITSFPGDRYRAGRFPEMLKAFEGATADKELTEDEWGLLLSGYAPIRDKNGATVAILGVDITAPEVYGIQRAVHKEAIFVLVLGLILSVVLGMLLSGSITNPIEKLVEATRHISQGDLKHRVVVKRKDEIGELADCFNTMAESLRDYSNRVHDYFYDVIQSLVRIVEARDHYTRGHSERVAEFAEKIALKMEFSPEEVEIIKETALLHDIGKLGIHESILNKKEKLTDEEWEEIRRHPLIGEDILKPVSLHPQMLAIVRGHHERYDGKGYPDRLADGQIDFFAQIMAVADAYDAMTSHRAYRSSLSKEEAIAELVRNKGTQFNPKIVNIFISILNQEDKR